MFKFVFVGPESSGKTTLCKKLAERYNAIWVPEACRLAAEQRDALNPDDIVQFSFTLADFIEMAKLQNGMELECQRRCEKMLLCDNDTFALSIWCERYLGEHQDTIYSMYEEASDLNNHAKVYILTKPNVPFVQDGYRDGEHIREWMYAKFIEELVKRGMRYYVIDSPDYNERFLKAVQIIESCMQVEKKNEN